MILLSFDCALKTMGVVLLYYNENWKNELIKEFNKIKNKLNNITIKDINDLNEILDNKKILFLEVAYVCSAKEKIADKIYKLNEYLKNLNKKVENILKEKNLEKEKFKVIIERQNPNNHNSVPISHCLLYEYSEYKPCLIGASVKNQIELDLNKSFGDFIEKYSTSYMARKKHSENNLIQYLTRNNELHLIKDIKKKDDVADAFNQICGWINYIYEKK